MIQPIALRLPPLFYSFHLLRPSYPLPCSLARPPSVSSVLDDNEARFGKQHLFDGQDDTCWNSDEGPSQSITLKLSTPVTLTRVEITFQGGFASRTVALSVCAGATGAKEVGNKAEKGKLVFRAAATFATQDSHSAQPLVLPLPAAHVTAVKLALTQSSDFFGRVIVYRLAVFGAPELEQSEQSEQRGEREASDPASGGVAGTAAERAGVIARAQQEDST